MITHLFIINSQSSIFKVISTIKSSPPDYLIKKICFNNTTEITSHAFHEYCISIGIEVEHLVPHGHTQNRLVESLLKHLKLVARPLLMRANLLMTTWGYAILHVALLIGIKSTSYHK